MYISLGLLWLCFEVIRGTITQCSMGGIDEEGLGLVLVEGKLVNQDLCSKLIKGTVLYRFYLHGLNTYIYGRLLENDYDVYDVPYTKFNENSKIRALSEMNSLIPLDLMRPSVTCENRTNIFTGQVMNTEEYKQLFSEIICRQSLIMEDSKQIKEALDDAFTIGTDIYRLKVHNKLVFKYKEKENTLSIEECLLFIESYYNAASIYYFSRIYITAMHVIEDGIRFGVLVRDFQFKNMQLESKELNAWIFLCDLLKGDIVIHIPENKIPAGINISLSSDAALNSAEAPFDFSSLVLRFRRYFLDNKLNASQKAGFNELGDYFGSMNDDKIIYTKNNSMYNYLILSTFSKTTKDKITNIIKAIERPVLSIEDRLLNYKAILITMDLTQLCLDEDGLLISSDICKPVTELKESNTIFREKIIPKLKNIQDIKHNTDIIDKLIINLSIKTKINENILHTIVTKAIDMIDVNTNKYKTNIENIKSAIMILQNYIKALGTNIQIDTDDFQNSKLKKRDIDEMISLITRTSYSDFNIIEKNVFVAYKWLIELYGALCNNSENVIRYRKKIKYYIELANNVNIDDKNDDHLKYLKNKLDAKLLLADDSWEVSSWPGGWDFSGLIKENSKMYKKAVNRKSIIFEELNDLKNKSNCLYINKIEINILLYRLYIIMNSSGSEYEQLYPYLKSAVHEIVITSEDRMRNMEAHELLSMYLMMLNRDSIEKEKKNPGLIQGVIQYLFGI